MICRVFHGHGVWYVCFMDMKCGMSVFHGYGVWYVCVSWIQSVVCLCFMDTECGMSVFHGYGVCVVCLCFMDKDGGMSLFQCVLLLHCSVGAGCGMSVS